MRTAARRLAYALFCLMVLSVSGSARLGLTPATPGPLIDALGDGFVLANGWVLKQADLDVASPWSPLVRHGDRPNHLP